ncbi:NRPS cluster protein [Microsporum ferrugineum]
MGSFSPTGDWDRVFDKSVCISLPFSSSVTEALKKAEQNPSFSTVHLFYAAWSMVLSTLSGEDDVSFAIFDPAGSSTRLKELKLLSLQMEKDMSVHDLVVIIQTKGEGDSRSPELEDTVESVALQFDSKYASNMDQEYSALHIQKCNLIACLRDGQILQIAGNNAYYEISAIESIASCTAQALLSMASDINRNLSSVCLVDKAGQQSIISQNNRAPDAIERCLHHLIEDQVKMRPKDDAIRFGGRVFSYQEMYEMSSRLAEHLVARGIKSETAVPICFDKSALAIISILAVLQAGGMCVPLDPSHPAERLLEIIAKCKAKLILVSASHATLIKPLAEPVIVEDQLFAELPSSSHSRPGQLVVPDSAAFVMFTSGSTGTPKGVVIEHRAITTSIKSNARFLRIDHRTRALQFASYTFDVAIEEIFTPLSQGGCVCVPTELERDNGLADFIAKHQVTWADMTPTVASALLKPEQVPSLRTLVLGGETVSSEVVKTWNDQLDLIIMYGPAECAINCAGNDSVDSKKGGQHLGAALSSVLWVVDRNNHHQLCPRGGVGELLVEGPILARGYLGEQQKTDSSFVTDLRWTGGGNGRRFYKTGDLVRHNYDGSLDFVRRMDGQIKVRGQRVETEEIKACLRSLLSEDWSSTVDQLTIDKRRVLCLFICNGSAIGHGVPDLDEGDSAIAMCEQIPNFLAQRLPSFMVPSLVVALRFTPTLASGKLDRRSLQKVAGIVVAQHSRTDRSNGVDVNNFTGTQQRLRHLWATVLNIPLETIGRDKSFFMLGGDSLLAMKLVSTASTAGIHFTVKDLLQGPTFGQLSQLVESGAIEERRQYTSTLTSSSLKDYEVASVEAAEQCKVSLSSIANVFPCSPYQEGIFALSQSIPNSYIARFVFHIPDTLDCGRYFHAWKDVICAHEVLRTRFFYHEGKLHNAVWGTAIDPIIATDLHQYLESDQSLAMDIGSPLLRYALVGDITTTKSLVLTIHHAIYDGFSLDLLLEEVELRYKGETISPAPQFSEYIHALTDHNVDSDILYWREYMDGAMPKQLPSGTNISCSRSVKSISKGNASLKSANSGGTTRAALVRAAWSMVLSLYTVSEDVVFGEILAGRYIDLPGIDKLIGPTMSTVPVRVKLCRELTVQEHLDNMALDYLNSMSHAQIGLQGIRGAISNGTLCDFDTLLVIQPNPLGHGIRECPLPAFVDERDRSTFSVTMECTMLQDSVELEAHYLSDRIDTELVKSLVDSFVDTVEKLSKNLLTRIEDVLPDLIPDTNGQRTTEPCPPRINRCIHEIFQDRASQHPDAYAVDSTCLSKPITYSELNDLSDKVALYLQHLGIQPGEIVPYCLSKSAQVVPTLLGVLKSGGAIVALDPRNPAERMTEIVQDTNARFVITEEEQADKLDHLQDHVQIIDIKSLFGHGMSGEVKPQSTPTSRCYVLFTSGSTGKPKGIVIQHSAYATSAHYHAPAMGITQNSRVLQFAAHTYDLCIGEIFTTLQVGGCICIPTEYERLNELAETITSLQVNWAFLTPTVAATLDSEAVPTLKTLVLGGEHATRRNFSSFASKLKLINSYGPAECSIWTNCAAGVKPDADTGNIGPKVGCNLFVVARDDHNQLLSLEEEGELVVESHGLALEYLSDPQKTAQSFIANPPWLPVDPGQIRRIYKSGDLAIANRDGTFKIIGRKDKQVKFHGQRIELGEIEHHIAGHPEIKHVAAFLIKKGPCNNSLVAIYTPVLSTVSEVHADIKLVLPNFINPVRRLNSELGEMLGKSIPSYMIPRFFIPVQYIPLMTSGKIERATLQRWVESMDEKLFADFLDLTLDTSSTETPKTDMEKILHQMWCDALNLNHSQVSIRKSFLESGGDSISVMRVAWLCKKRGIMVTVQDVITCQSISDLSLRASRQAKDTQVKERNIDLHPVNPNIPFHLSPIQKLFFASAKETRLEELNHFNQSFMMEVRREISPNSIEKAVIKLVQLHDMLRARFQQHSYGIWAQDTTNTIENSYRFNSHTLDSLHSIRSLVVDSQLALNILHGPLISFDIFHIAGRQYLFATAHHLVIDLVSWRVIFDDLEELLKNPMSQIPKGIPFQQWLNCQRDHAFNKLDPPNMLPELPQKPRPAFWGTECEQNMFKDTREVSFGMNELQTAHILETCTKELGITPLDVFNGCALYSFNVVFPERVEPTLFNEGHGREPWSADIDISRTVGWFTTMFPITVPRTTNHNVLLTCMAARDYRMKLHSNGWGYFTSRFLHPEGIELYGSQYPEILLNYYGLYQQFEHPNSLFRPAEQNFYDLDVNSLSPRFSLVDILIGVEKNRLHFNMVFNKHMKHQSRLDEWANAYRRSIIQVIGIVTMKLTTGNSLTYPIAPEDRTQLHALRVDPETMVEDIYPCSPMQEAILNSQTENPGFYRVKYVWRLTSYSGIVDRCRLLSAWDTLVGVHSALRTVFLNADSNQCSYYQVVIRSDYVREIKEKLPYSIDITTQKNEDCIICTLNISHALIDGSSISIILKDWASAYDGGLQQGTRPSYRKYIDYLSSKSEFDSATYWRRYLKGVRPCMFPTTYTTASPPRNIHLTHSTTLCSSATLTSLCHAIGATSTSVLLFVWGLIVRHYVAIDEVCFGYLVSGRDPSVEGVGSIVGPFVHMLPCRWKAIASDTAKDEVERLQMNFFEALPYQEFKLSLMQKEAGLSGNPLFNTALSFQQNASTSQEFDLPIHFEDVGGADPSEYAIAVNFEDDGKGIQLTLNFWESEIEEDKISNIASMLKMALNTFSENPKITIASLDDQLLKMIHREYMKRQPQLIIQPDKTCTHLLIDNHVRAFPQSEAIRTTSSQFAYSELHDLSSRLASLICKETPAQDTVVALGFIKGPWTVIAMLACLKAGRPFLMLDLRQPVERLEYMLAVSEASLLLYQKNSADYSFDAFHTVAKASVSFDVIRALPQLEEEKYCMDPNVRAYVIFTSGSTGRPKGIEVTNKTLSNGVTNHAKALGIEKSSQVLQFSSYSFDASIVEIITTLATGGVVCIPTEVEREDLPSAINSLCIDTAIITPSVAKILQPNEIPGLKTLVLAGEAMTASILEMWAPKVKLINGYGPSECCVCCSASEMSVNSDPRCIGRPLGSHIWITNSQNHDLLMPAGEIGELVVQGPILAQGYLKDPEKTSDAFVIEPNWMKLIPNPTGTPRRIYKTGDLACLQRDGTLLFIGRKDTQVKIRGQRVELGEIEQRLSLLYTNSNLIAAVPTKGLFKKQIVCILQVTESLTVKDTGNDIIPLQTHLVTEVREQVSRICSNLETKLPSYMIPSVWLGFSKVPLLPSGKINRSILHSYLNEIGEEMVSLVRLDNEPEEIDCDRPLNERELHFQQLLGKHFGCDSMYIDMTKSYLALGGDSISAMRFISSCKNEGKTFRLLELLQAPNMLHMARMTSEVIPVNTSRASSMAIHKSDTGYSTKNSEEAIFPCSDTQISILKSQVRDPRLYIAKAVWLFTAHDGYLDVGRLRDAWIECARKSDVLRVRFFEVDGTYKQIISPESLNDPTIIASESADPLTSLVSHGPITCEGNTPPCRFLIMPVDKKNALCRLDINHAITDGTSISILLDNLLSAYHRRPTFTEDGFRQYITRCLTNTTGDSSIYWQKYMKSMPACNLNGFRQKEASHIHTLGFDTSAQAAESFCRQRGITLFSLLGLVWAMTLCAETGSYDVSFGYISSCRNEPWEEDIMGPLIACLPCRKHLRGAETIKDALNDLQIDFAHGSQAGQEGSGLRLFDAHSRAFNTLINFRNFAESSHTDITDIKVKHEFSQDPMDFDVVFSGHVDKDRIVLELSAWRGSDETTQQLLRTVQDIFKQILQEKSATIDGILKSFRK